MMVVLTVDMMAVLSDLLSVEKRVVSLAESTAETMVDKKVVKMVVKWVGWRAELRADKLADL